MALANKLVDDLPPMISGAFAASGVEIALDEMSVDIQPYSARAYNSPTFEVVVLTGSQVASTAEGLAGLRDVLYRILLEWLHGPEAERIAYRAHLDHGGVDVDVRYVLMAGVNFMLDGTVNSRWGDPEEGVTSPSS